MATFTWFGFFEAGPAWTDIAANTVVFASSLTDLATNITVDGYNDGTHVGNGDPGADQCGANHMNNIKFDTTTAFFLNGGGSEVLNDTNLTADECSIRVHFTDASSVATSSARFYCYDGTTTTTEATDIQAYGHEQGQGNTTWVEICDDTADIGGDNAGERVDVADSGAATTHTFYFAITAGPEAVGAKTAFDFGMALTFS